MDPSVPTAVARLMTTLEALPAGNRQLSEQVLVALGWKQERFGCPGGCFWRTAAEEMHAGPLPNVTESIESARALLPPALSAVVQQVGSEKWRVDIYDQLAAVEEEDPLRRRVSVVANTLPLALCSAALQVHQATQKYPLGAGGEGPL